MANVDVKQFIKDSSAAVKKILGKSWKSFKPYAEHEFNQFASNIQFLSSLKIKKQISDEEFKERLELQRIAFKNVLLAIEGIGSVAAQQAVNATLDLIKKAIFKALKITLPI